MLFSSLVFLLFFLPCFYLVYTCVPQGWKNTILLIFSLLFYAWGEPVCVLLMVASVLWNYFFGGAIAQCEKEKRSASLRKIIFIVGASGNILLLIIMKYADMLIGLVNCLPGISMKALKIALPIGISFYTFQSLSYLADVYMGKVEAADNLCDFGAYITMFPQLIAGPVVRYETVQRELKDRKTDTEEISRGIFRFTIGLSKKILIANTLGGVYKDICLINTELPMPLAWLKAASYTLQIYFDFSGYSDMAIGLGLMMGFHFNENFNYPYLSASVTEFWRRWHISLSTWFKEYVYIPLGGNKKGLLRQIRNILIVWILTGLWHGAGVNFLLWGIYYGILLIIEKLLKKWVRQVPRLLGQLYTMLFVIFGWVLFTENDVSGVMRMLRGMLNVKSMASPYALYLLKANGITFFVSILLSLGIYPHLKRLIKKFPCVNEDVIALAKTGFVFFSLIACIAVLLRGSYNPFLYYRF